MHWLCSATELSGGSCLVVRDPRVAARASDFGRRVSDATVPQPAFRSFRALPFGSPLNHRRTALLGRCLPSTAFSISPNHRRLESPSLWHLDFLRPTPPSFAGAQCERMRRANLITCRVIAGEFSTNRALPDQAQPVGMADGVGDQPRRSILWIAGPAFRRWAAGVRTAAA